MRRIYSKILMLAFLAASTCGLSSCEEDLTSEQEIPFAPYVLSLGVTSSGNTTPDFITFLRHRIAQIENQ